MYVCMYVFIYSSVIYIYMYTNIYIYTHLYFWMGQNPKIGAQAHVSLPSLMPHSLLGKCAPGAPGRYVEET